MTGHRTASWTYGLTAKYGLVFWDQFYESNKLGVWPSIGALGISPSNQQIICEGRQCSIEFVSLC